MYYKLQFRLRYDLIINVSREIYFSQGSSSSWWEMSEYLIRSITPFFFRRKISASIDSKQYRYEIFISSLFFPQLSCTHPFLSSTSLILSLSFSLPLFLSHSAHIQLVEKLRQLLHFLSSLVAPFLLFRSFLFFFFGILKILSSLEFLNS